MKKLLLLSFLFAQGVIALPPGYAPASVFNHETGVPLDADCDSLSEYGRVHIQTDTPDAALWICGIGGWINGVGSGLTYDPVTKQTAVIDESIGGDVSIVVENTAASGVSNAKVKVKAAGGGKSKVLFSDTDADRASITSDTGDDLVFATGGSGLVTALTIDSSQDATFAGDATVTGTLAAATVSGANVTSGADPGHTHTAGIGSGDLFTTSSGSSTLSTTAIRYFSPSGNAAPNATETNVYQIFPAGAITPVNLTCRIGGGALSAGSYTFTLRVGLADTDWSCALTAASGVEWCADTSGTGLLGGSGSYNVMSIKVTPSAGPAPAARTAACAITF